MVLLTPFGCRHGDGAITRCGIARGARSPGRSTILSGHLTDHTMLLLTDIASVMRQPSIVHIVILR